MASIDTTRDKNGRAVQHRVRYRTPDGAQRSKTFKKKEEADAFLTSIEHRKNSGEYVDPSAGKMTFAEYAERWLDRKRQTVKPTTAETFAAHIRKHLVPAFGRRQLSTIDREAVKQFAGSLQRDTTTASGAGSKAVASTTARAVVFTLAAVLREAVDDGRIVKNPAERVKVGAKTERRVDPRHIAQVAGKVPELAEGMPPRWSAGVLLMATVGLRLGECLGLTVDRVDFLRRSIRVDRQLANVAGQTGFASPKTKAGIRTIPVPVRVVELLAAHLAEFPAGDQGLIFTTTRGGPVPRSNWSDHYRQACATAGLDRTRTHDLRHVAASSLIAAGLSVAAVQAVLGHASPAETLDVYTHLWPTDEERTRDAIEAASASWLPRSEAAL
ncbi:MAG: tyrosine-type recombinase/integrase [Actinobacteria bacterium]|nr:tyrosine-type recombinase/integrase [Actinomycetota bacterium]